MGNTAHAPTLSLRSLGPEGGVAEEACLIVFEGESASRFDLPPAGEVVIGRAAEAHVRVAESSVSRAHAKLLIAGGQIRALDLGSRNGTRVNGELITGSRPLASGDAIAIADGVLLVLQRRTAPERERAILSREDLIARLDEEVDRSARYRCPVSLASVALPDESRAADVAERLRLIDVAGWDDHGLLLVLPELGADEALAAMREVARALKLRVGLATCPRDGLASDALISGARGARDTARPGEPASAADNARTISIAGKEVVLADPAMVRLYALIEKLAASDISVLINGETGSGKELAATALHTWSKRKRGPLITVNCAALPEGLAESELFGHERGAFSGAVAAKPGLLEAANGGTVFLDEVGELPLALQAKLLRAIENHRVTRVGDVVERTLDLRVVAATHRDLEAEVEAGRFRQDLFFRLATARIALPALRYRHRELVLLAERLLTDACAKIERPAMKLTPAAVRAILAYRWPGNVRELKNAMELAAATAEGESLDWWQLPDRVRGESPEEQPSPERAEEQPARAFRPIDEEVRELERTRMAEALTAAGGNQTRAAQLISMPLRTFVTKVKQYNLPTRADLRAKSKA